MRLLSMMVALIATNLLYSQQNTSTGGGQLLNEESDGLVGGMSDLTLYKRVRSGPEEVTGNPFLFEEWNNSGVVYSKGVAHSISKLNYNLYTDDVAELKSQNEVFVFDKKAIDSLMIKGKKFHKLNGSFYEILSDGDKIGLLKRYTTRVQKGQFNPTDGTTTPSRLVKMDDYYTLQGGNTDKFKPSKSNIMDLFEDQQSEIKKLIKDEKLSYKEEKDLKRMFDFYNNL